MEERSDGSDQLSLGSEFRDQSLESVTKLDRIGESIDGQGEDSME